MSAVGVAAARPANRRVGGGSRPTTALHDLRVAPVPLRAAKGRLVRHHYIEQCDHTTLALYLFLVTVADAQGLSFYSDQSLCQRLDLDTPGLARARDWLAHVQLIAYQAPLYQVLALEGEDD